MLYVIFLCFWTSLFLASQDDRELEIFLSKIIKEDNNEPVKNFTTHQEVECKKRELNNGMLPLSPQAKDQIKCHLWSYFEEEDKAIDFFKGMAEKHTLYPLLVEKTIAMIQSEYVSYPTADVPLSLRIVRVKPSCNRDEIVSELSRLELHCSCLSEKLNKIKSKRKNLLLRKHRSDMNKFKIIPLHKIPLRRDLGFDKDV